MYKKDEVQQLRKEFWASFSNYTKFYSQKIGEPVQWLLYRTGIKGVELKFDLENKFIRLVLEVNSKSDDRRFDIFVELDRYRKIIETGFDNKLGWFDDFELPEGKMVSRVHIELHGLNYYNTENWPEIFKFMAENMHALQSNFIDILPILEDKFEM
jgi:hypothetical protein